MTRDFSAKDREAINVLTIATKGVLDDFRALVILMSLIAQYDVIKNQFSEELARIIVEGKSINSSDLKDVTLSKVQKMHDDSKNLESGQ